MALKNMLDSLKKESYVVSKLDFYLTSRNEDNDRALDVNSPSAVGTCLRARYYKRTGQGSAETLSARTYRIFDNGTGVHERLQNYLLDMNLLLMDEVPVHNDSYGIQGHTDGILQLTEDELGVLEIKSMNDRNFAMLKDAEPKHKMQALVYLYCLEQRRQYLREHYKHLEFTSMYDYYAGYYQHLQSGSKHTREEKIFFQADLCYQRDLILIGSEVPLTKCVILYENKNNQELKEFTVSALLPEHQELLVTVLEECDMLNEAVGSETIPEREGKNKSDPYCRWCDYKNTICWVV